MCVCACCVCMYVCVYAGDAPPLSGVKDSGPPRPQMPYDDSKQGVWYLVFGIRNENLLPEHIPIPPP